MKRTPGQIFNNFFRICGARRNISFFEGNGHQVIDSRRAQRATYVAPSRPACSTCACFSNDGHPRIDAQRNGAKRRVA